MTKITRSRIHVLMDPRPNGSITIFSIGMRVQAHPACDCWMMGDRFGTITKITRSRIHVLMDRSTKTRRFTPDLLETTR